MENENINGQLFRFFMGETTAEENDKIVAWIEENPAKRQKQFDEAHAVFLLSVMGETPKLNESIPRKDRYFRILKNTVNIAAALIVGFVGAYMFFDYSLSSIVKQEMILQAPQGQHIDVTLGDGSKIALNSGSKLVYPSVFYGHERRVKLYGEAHFDIAPNKKKPFIVETFAYDVKVLGTEFNVVAIEQENMFSTALFKGYVSILDHEDRQHLVLEPEQLVKLDNGGLKLMQLDDMDEYLWREGIISFKGNNFNDMIAKIKKYYNVNIELQCDEVPDVCFKRLKIRISDGVEHALRVLQIAANFDYEYNSDENKIIIK